MTQAAAARDQLPRWIAIVLALATILVAAWMGGWLHR
jgi:hypothetical protein